MTEQNPVPPPPPSEPTPPASYEGPAGIEQNPQARQWGMISHLSALVGLIGVPPILGPLVVWLLKKNESPFVDDQGKEAVNFQLTALIAGLVLTPTICLAGLGIILLIALGVVVLVLSIIAGMKANEGIAYRYPWTLRLIK